MEAIPPVRSSLLGILLQVVRLSVLVRGGGRGTPRLTFPATSELLNPALPVPVQGTQATAGLGE